MSNTYTVIVDGSLGLLVAFSVATWSLIAIKAVQHLRQARQNKVFTQAFWRAADLEAASKLENPEGSAARLAEVGFATLRSADNSAVHDLEHSWDRQDLLERHLRQHIQKERRSLESGLAVLASIGSTAPFVGLFGTVFGIIHALSAITSNASASIEIVAGPIGEALIATGIGIAVAVPSVLAYNFFVRRLKLIAADLDDFATDFVSLAQKTGFRLKTQGNRAKAADAAQPAKKEVFA
ncbi:MAG TPA: MotA/TolQ/ExbB proton channel family protein [Fluviicoccus sp.]|nr:MotA/TolQ/ExbB proton channel family protein [Fluviicoccus sp.]